MQKQTVLSVGLICLDVVVNCESYPVEDTDQRCQSIQWKRGGNASNNCTVFSQLGISSEYLGNISCDIPGKFLKENILCENISIDNCIFVDDYNCPTSCVILNGANGSRTIQHSRGNFPEFQFENFLKVDLSKYSWIHFEGRNVDETKKMMERVSKWKEATGSRVPVSVEIEKARPEKLELLSYGADFVFVDKDFARMCGYENMDMAVKGFASKVKKGAAVICAWGDHGACALLTGQGENGEEQRAFLSPPFPPACMVDTLGAGDTFVASTIVALLKGRSVKMAISFGCQMAGAKCGLEGFSGLGRVYELVKEEINI